jgi:hypothetical protein
MVIILLIVMYLNPILFFGFMTDKFGLYNYVIDYEVYSKIWLIIFVVFVIINFILIIKNNKIDILYKNMKVIKLGLIPFYIINIIYYMYLFFPFEFLQNGYALIYLFIIIVTLYIYVVISSMFTIIYLKCLHKNKILNLEKLIIHALLQLIFICDIIDVLIIIKKHRKSNVA